ncbi:MAG: NifB/NifX family molybdenum-iron cluster-binding protein [Bacteroidota bacterium]|nr:NifB/NifX family molybdenum-iron cluster-binding protein [Bacteroidota bacterium]
MKVAITSTGNTIDSRLDSRFGRCSFFVIYNTDSKSVEFIPNPNKDNLEGAGPASVQLVASLGVKLVVSGEFGAKVKSVFDSLQIQLVMIPDENKTIVTIMEMLDHKNE